MRSWTPDSLANARGDSLLLLETMTEAPVPVISCETDGEAKPEARTPKHANKNKQQEPPKHSSAFHEHPSVAQVSPGGPPRAYYPPRYYPGEYEYRRGGYPPPPGYGPYPYPSNSFESHPPPQWGPPPPYQRYPEYAPPPPPQHQHSSNSAFSRAVSSSFDRSVKTLPPVHDDASWGQLQQVTSVDEEERKKRPASTSSSLTNSPTDHKKLDSLSSVASAQEPLDTKKSPSPTGSLDLLKCPSGSSGLLMPTHHSISSKDEPDSKKKPRLEPPQQMPSWEINPQDSFGGVANFSFSHDYPMLAASASQEEQPPLESRNQSFEQYPVHRTDSMMSYEARQPPYPYQYPAPSWGSYPPPPPYQRHPDFRAPPTNAMKRSAPTTQIVANYSNLKSPYAWSKEEDARPTDILKKYKNPRDWEPIAKELNSGRSAKEVHERWIRYLKPGVRKGQWTDQEDAIVMEVVSSSSEQPFTRWSDLAQRLPGRVGKQIRDRWVNHLNPNINHLPFSREDDLLLWEGHTQLGKRWVEISTKFFNSSRSENHIKNRWYSASFKKFIANEFGPDAYSGGKQRKQPKKVEV